MKKLISVELIWNSASLVEVDGHPHLINKSASNKIYMGAAKSIFIKNLNSVKGFLAPQFLTLSYLPAVSVVLNGL